MEQCRTHTTVRVNQSLHHPMPLSARIEREPDALSRTEWTARFGWTTCSRRYLITTVLANLESAFTGETHEKTSERYHSPTSEPARLGGPTADDCSFESLMREMAVVRFGTTVKGGEVLFGKRSLQSHLEHLPRQSDFSPFFSSHSIFGLFHECTEHPELPDARRETVFAVPK